MLLIFYLSESFLV